MCHCHFVSIFPFVAKRDQTCACIVTHTYKQIRKLWENPEKQALGPNGLVTAAKFDDDIDRSTSSSTGVYHISSFSSLFWLSFPLYLNCIIFVCVCVLFCASRVVFTVTKYTLHFVRVRILLKWYLELFSVMNFHRCSHI